MSNPADGFDGIAYSSRAHDLVRFASDPADDTVADFVRDFVRLDRPGRDTTRASLSGDDQYTLTTFSRRRATDALRQQSLPLAQEALASVCAVTTSSIDFRDLSIDFPLYAVAHLGGDVEQAIKSGIELSENGTAAVFAARLRTAPAGPTLRSCALMGVESAHGLGFIRQSTSRYEPERDLAKLAIRLADALDADGTYRIIDLYLADLPEVWFKASTSGRPVNVETTGCAHIAARVTEAPIWAFHGLRIFLAELPESTTAVQLAEQARANSTAHKPRVAINHERVLAVLIASTWMADRPTTETIESLARYLPLIESILGAE